mgnify:CR=1 FL=1
MPHTFSKRMTKIENNNGTIVNKTIPITGNDKIVIWKFSSNKLLIVSLNDFGFPAYLSGYFNT